MGLCGYSGGAKEGWELVWMGGNLWLLKLNGDGIFKGVGLIF